jgi:hypothetical protein
VIGQSQRLIGPEYSINKRRGYMGGHSGRLSIPMIVNSIGCFNAFTAQSAYFFAAEKTPSLTLPALIESPVT